MLKKVTSCLSSQLNDLTIQIVKDDWNVPISSFPRSSPTASPTLISSTTHAPNYPLIGEVPLISAAKLPPENFHTHSHHHGYHGHTHH